MGLGFSYLSPDAITVVLSALYPEISLFPLTSDFHRPIHLLSVVAQNPVRHPRDSVCCPETEEQPVFFSGLNNLGSPANVIFTLTYASHRASTVTSPSFYFHLKYRHHRPVTPAQDPYLHRHSLIFPHNSKFITDPSLDQQPDIMYFLVHDNILSVNWNYTTMSSLVDSDDEFRHSQTDTDTSLSESQLRRLHRAKKKAAKRRKKPKKKTPEESEPEPTTPEDPMEVDPEVEVVAVRAARTINQPEDASINSSLTAKTSNIGAPSSLKKAASSSSPPKTLRFTTVEESTSPSPSHSPESPIPTNSPGPSVPPDAPMDTPVAPTDPSLRSFEDDDNVHACRLSFHADLRPDLAWRLMDSSHPSIPGQHPFATSLVKLISASNKHWKDRVTIISSKSHREITMDYFMRPVTLQQFAKDFYYHAWSGEGPNVHITLYLRLRDLSNLFAYKQPMFQYLRAQSLQLRPHAGSPEEVLRKLVGFNPALEPVATHRVKLAARLNADIKSFYTDPENAGYVKELVLAHLGRTDWTPDEGFPDVEVGIEVFHFNHQNEAHSVKVLGYRCPPAYASAMTFILAKLSQSHEKPTFTPMVFRRKKSSLYYQSLMDARDFQASVTTVTLWNLTSSDRAYLHSKIQDSPGFLQFESTPVTEKVGKYIIVAMSAEAPNLFQNISVLLRSCPQDLTRRWSLMPRIAIQPDHAIDQGLIQQHEKRLPPPPVDTPNAWKLPRPASLRASPSQPTASPLPPAYAARLSVLERSMKDQAAALAAFQQETQETLTQRDTSFTQTLQDHGRQIQAQDAKLDRFMARTDSNYSSLQSDVSSVQLQVQSIQSEVASVSTQLQTLGSTLGDLTPDIEHVKGAVDSMVTTEAFTRSHEAVTQTQATLLATLQNLQNQLVSDRLAHSTSKRLRTDGTMTPSTLATGYSDHTDLEGMDLDHVELRNATPLRPRCTTEGS